jgi:hypothetical protein
MTQSNGQQRPANPNRITIWHSKPFPDGRPAASEFSVNAFISLDLLRALYDAVATGLIQPENNYQGVPGIQLWGNGYRGNPGQNGAPGPVLGGTLNTPKAIYQQQQAAQQQVAPAYGHAFPAQQQMPPQQAPAAAPAQPAPWQAPELPQQQQPAPQAAPAPVQQGWAAQPAQGNQWASTPPAL